MKKNILFKSIALLLVLIMSWESVIFGNTPTPINLSSANYKAPADTLRPKSLSNTFQFVSDFKSPLKFSYNTRNILSDNHVGNSYKYTFLKGIIAALTAVFLLFSPMLFGGCATGKLDLDVYNKLPSEVQSKISPQGDLLDIDSLSSIPKCSQQDSSNNLPTIASLPAAEDLKNISQKNIEPLLLKYNTALNIKKLEAIKAYNKYLQAVVNDATLKIGLGINEFDALISNTGFFPSFFNITIENDHGLNLLDWFNNNMNCGQPRLSLNIPGFSGKNMYSRERSDDIAIAQEKLMMTLIDYEISKRDMLFTARGLFFQVKINYLKYLSARQKVKLFEAKVQKIKQTNSVIRGLYDFKQAESEHEEALREASLARIEYQKSTRKFSFMVFEKNNINISFKSKRYKFFDNKEILNIADLLDFKKKKELSQFLRLSLNGNSNVARGVADFLDVDCEERCSAADLLRRSSYAIDGTGSAARSMDAKNILFLNSATRNVLTANNDLEAEHFRIAIKINKIEMEKVRRQRKGAISINLGASAMSAAEGNNSSDTDVTFGLLGVGVNVKIPLTQRRNDLQLKSHDIEDSIFHLQADRAREIAKKRYLDLIDKLKAAQGDIEFQLFSLTEALSGLKATDDQLKKEAADTSTIYLPSYFDITDNLYKISESLFSLEVLSLECQNITESVKQSSAGQIVKPELKPQKGPWANKIINKVKFFIIVLAIFIAPIFANQSSAMSNSNGSGFLYPQPQHKIVSIQDRAAQKVPLILRKKAIMASYEVEATPIAQKTEIRMPFNGIVEPLSSKDKIFKKAERVIRITQSQATYDQERIDVKQAYERLLVKSSDYESLYKENIISQLEYKEFIRDLNIAKEKIKGIESTMTRTISFPFDGRLRVSRTGKVQKGSIIAKVENYNYLALTLYLPEEITYQIQRGRGFALLCNGRRIGIDNYHIFNDRVKVSIRDGFIKPHQVSIFSVVLDDVLSADSKVEQKGWVSTDALEYTDSETIIAPRSGFISNTQTASINGNSAEWVLTYDTTDIETELRCLREKISFQQWLTDSCRKLHELNVGSMTKVKHEELKLRQLYEKTQLLKKRQTGLRSCRIEYPGNSSVVERRFLPNNSYVHEGEVLMVINPGIFRASCRIDNSVISNAQVGARITVSLEALDNIFTATISSLSKMPDGTYKVELEIKDPDGIIKPGQKLKAYLSETQNYTSPVYIDLIKEKSGLTDYSIGQGRVAGEHLRELTLSRIKASTDTDYMVSEIKAIAAHRNNDLLLDICLSSDIPYEVREFSLLNIYLNNAPRYLFLAFQEMYTFQPKIDQRLLGMIDYAAYLITEYLFSYNGSIYSNPDMQAKNLQKAVDDYLEFILLGHRPFCETIVCRQLSINDRYKQHQVLTRLAQRNSQLTIAANDAFLKKRALEYLEYRKKNYVQDIMYNNSFLYPLNFYRSENDLSIFFTTELFGAQNVLSRVAPGFLSELGISARKTAVSAIAYPHSTYNLPNTVSYYAGLPFSEQKRIIKRLEDIGAGFLADCMRLQNPSNFEYIFRESKGTGSLVKCYYNVPDKHKEKFIADMHRHGFLYSRENNKKYMSENSLENRLLLRHFYLDVFSKAFYPDGTQAALFDALLETHSSNIAIANLAYGDPKWIQAYDNVSMADIDKIRGIAKRHLRRSVLVTLLDERESNYARQAEEKGDMKAKVRIAQIKDIRDNLRNTDVAAEPGRLSDLELKAKEAGVKGFNERFELFSDVFHEKKEFWRKPMFLPLSIILGIFFTMSVIIFIYLLKPWRLPPLLFEKINNRLRGRKKTKIVQEAGFDNVSDNLNASQKIDADAALEGLNIAQGTIADTVIESKETNQEMSFFSAPASLSFLRKPILRTWAMINRVELSRVGYKKGDQWIKLYKDYRKTLLGFSTIITFRFIFSIGFMLLSLSMNINPISAILGLFVVLMGLDFFTEWLKEFVTENLGKIFRDKFPAMLDLEVRDKKDMRTIKDDELKWLFADSFRASNIYATGKLALIYALEHLSIVLSIFITLIIANLWELAIASFVFTGVLAAIFAACAYSKNSMGNLGVKKQAVIQKWIVDNAFKSSYRMKWNLSEALQKKIDPEIEAFIKERMKTSAFLRIAGFGLIITAAIFGSPLFALFVFFRIEALYFLPVLAKAIAEASFFEKQIFNFTNRVSEYVSRIPVSPVEQKNNMINPESLALSDVTIAADGKILLDHVSERFEFGTVNAIVGAMGCGKTTLLTAIAQENTGLISTGNIDIIGRDNSDQHYTINTQGHRQYFHYCNFENALDPIDLSSIAGELGSKKYKEFIDFLKKNIREDIEHICSRDALAVLSDGQKRRMRLAYFLFTSKAPVLLIDEAFTSGIDMKTANEWIEILKQKAAKSQEWPNGRLILVAEPTRDKIQGNYDRCLYVQNAKLISKEKNINDLMVQTEKALAAKWFYRKKLVVAFHESLGMSKENFFILEEKLKNFEPLILVPSFSDSEIDRLMETDVEFIFMFCPKEKKLNLHNKFNGVQCIIDNLKVLDTRSLFIIISYLIANYDNPDIENNFTAMLGKYLDKKININLNWEKRPSNTGLNELSLTAVEKSHPEPDNQSDHSAAKVPLFKIQSRLKHISAAA